MEVAKKFQAVVTLIHDHNVGRVYLDGDRKHIEYDLDDRDFESMRKALRGTAQIYFAAGARRRSICPRRGEPPSKAPTKSTRSSTT